ncbi:sigma-54-dependent transcriptional regulator [Kingella oralis]|uniref:Sigma-54 interaction domain protein n=1 Tax=Kingella oralis ATCC 51147 TaxID=629741 RepID=C4GFN2_9NEIS|nr:sigma-54 dependent transcriptional regulator [Kingella oralis]EEP69037.1 Sigma-54 interaction domain protein [Kingella oralis ATCC 51147]QMT41831.1 sigma-54-dependent Fis family transcriptional regulator [Kingella oralis]
MSTNNLNRPVLVVDDEADIRDLMEMTLMKMGLRVDTAEGVRAALSKLSSNKYSLVLTDMRMPDGSGLEVVQHINQQQLDVPVAVITAFGSAVQALKEGAFDYLQKPITLAQLRTLVKSAIKVQEDNSAPPAAAEPEPQAAPPQSPPVIIDIDDEDDFQAAATPAAQPIAKQPETIRQPENAAGELPRSPAKAAAGKPAVPVNESKLKMEADLPRLLGSSPQIETVRNLIRKLAPANVPVYISGESGSGKEQAARSIHELSPRKDGPFIAVNCGAIPENLMESEFFGYKKGSFTGADQDRLGFFQHAHGGTLFLDEVADLPLAMQVKLLRAIQEKAVRRIGDAQEVKVDVRIISATHKNLPALVESGAFRQDLFYRLNVVTLHMPALREMHEDLANLIAHLLRKHHSGDINMTPAAREALLRYNYPGNFRELENILERAVALASNHTIDVDDLQITTDPLGGGSAAVELEGTSQHQIVNGLPNFQMGTTQIQDYLDDIERQILEYALRLTQGNRTQAAKTLGISFRSMRYRLERLNIDLGA